MPFVPGLLAGRRALVTGGGTGLGRSIGRRFLELGASLAICGRRAAVLEAAAESFRGDVPGAVVTTHPCDIRDAAAVEAMPDDVWRQGAVDTRVNNAAANFLAQTHRLSARAVDTALGAPLHGAAYCTIGCGRRLLGGARAGAQEMLDWTDEQWAQQRARTPSR